MKKHLTILLTGLMIIANLTLFSRTVLSQQEQFVNNKLFGKYFIFTPKEKEFFVKFSITASQTEIENTFKQVEVY